MPPTPSDIGIFLSVLILALIAFYFCYLFVGGLFGYFQLWFSLIYSWFSRNRGPSRRQLANSLSLCCTYLAMIDEAARLLDGLSVPWHHRLRASVILSNAEKLKAVLMKDPLCECGLTTATCRIQEEPWNTPIQEEYPCPSNPSSPTSAPISASPASPSSCSVSPPSSPPST